MHDATLTELAAALRRKTISSAELTRLCLARCKKFNPALNCFITLDEDQALAQAEAADRRIAAGRQTPLTGIPYAHKDIFCAQGGKTSCGSKMLDNFIAPYDATVTARLNEAGMVMLGKTNMDEFAMGSSSETSFYGPVKNPWDQTRAPGGSSGGSAAAVAARLCPVATGTDTGGSIRKPASLCGITGLKPTYGRVSRHGMIAFASSLDQGGPLTRNAQKEEANDYRYFPEPDLPALTIEPALLDEIREQLLELPDARKQRFMRDYQLTEQDSIALALHKETADYFEACARAAGQEARLSANWINGELAANLNRENKAITQSPVNAQMLGGLIRRIKDGAISSKIAKQVFAAMWQGEGDADTIIKNKGLKQLTDTGAIEKLVDEIIAANPDQLKQSQASPPEKQARLIGYFVGQAMKKSQSKASPRQVNEVLRRKLKG